MFRLQHPEQDNADLDMLAGHGNLGILVYTANLTLNMVQALEAADFPGSFERAMDAITPYRGEMGRQSWSET